MKSVNIQISDFEFNRLGLDKNTLSLSKLIEIIGKKIRKQTLEKSLNPHYSSSFRSEGCIYNKISDKAIEAYPLIW